MKKKICLTTYFDGPFQEIGALCSFSLHEYAKRHGYDVRIGHIRHTDRPVSWNKIPCIQGLFKEGYEFVLWVDADAVITDYDSKIEDIIEDGKDMYIVNVAYAGGTIPSMGVFLLRNSSWSRELFEKVMNMAEYTYHPLWENMAICHLFGLVRPLSSDLHEGLPPAIRDKEPNMKLLARVKWLPPSWNWVWPGSVLKIKAIIKHYPATPMHVRYYMMTRDLREAGLLSAKRFITAFLRVLLIHFIRIPFRMITKNHFRVARMMTRDALKLPFI